MSNARRRGLGGAAALAILGAATGCGDDASGTGGASGTGDPGPASGPGSTQSSTASGPGGTGGAGSGGAGPTGSGAGSSGSGASGPTTGTGGAPPLPDEVLVTLTAQPGVDGPTIVNFAVPLGPGQLVDAAQVRVLDAGGAELPAARRALATYTDGSARSVQLQVEVDPAASTTLRVEIGSAPGAGDLARVEVSTTLLDPSGTSGPRVWATLPASWLSGSGVAGPLVPEADVESDPRLAAWASLCDADAWGSDAFFAESWESDRGVWLYDRGTALYRAYARRGDLSPLASAYVETATYLDRLTGDGSSARNGVPGGGSDDPKYQYAQNLAIHYLLTGDDRFREGAEDMALGMTELWPDPGYAGGDDMWTERNAGFALLAYTWAATVTDDAGAELGAAADEAFDATLAVQATYPVGYDDATHRCFAHHGDAHDPDEGNPYFGCSPWMSAILADAIDGYGRLRGGERATQARESLVQLGRILARDGRSAEDRPHYWMGVGTDQDAVDDYDEHIGESAYIVALARAIVGAPDAELDGALDALLAKFAADAEVGQIRSFNWQCRSAVMAPTFVP